MKNLEIQLEAFTPLEKDSLIRFLGQHFSKPKHQNALLILDDVFDKKIINTFDFECKTLVLTTDIGVLNGRKSERIKVTISEISFLLLHFDSKGLWSQNV